MTSPTRTVIIFTVPLLLLGGALFLISRSARDTQPAFVDPGPIEATFAEGAIPLDPLDPFWTARPADSIRLYPQAALPPFGTAERDLLVRAVYDDDEIAFHLEFADATPNVTDSTVTDACAVLLTAGDASAPSQIMGHGTASNVWHWQAHAPGQPADSGPVVRELLATGPGTQMPLAEQRVVALAAYADGRWRITFRRARAAAAPDEFAVDPDPGVRISFALWDDARREALSRKSIAELRPLRFAPAVGQ